MAKTVVAKKAVRRRKERKNIERGAVHISSTFNNTIVTRNCSFRGKGRWIRIPRFEEEHSFRSSDSC